MLENIFTPFRLKWYPRAILFAIGLSFLLIISIGHGASTLNGRVGGDYPAFYGAGRIIANGDWQNLYNPATQLQAQQGLLPEKKSNFLPFSYPPFLALIYYPLSLLNYRLSYIIHTLFMLGSLMLALQLLRPFSHTIDQYYLLTLAMALSFYPLFSGVLMGQNTAVILLIIVGAWRLALANREWLAGLILGLLLFKPQFALPLIGLYLLSGRWRVSLGSTFTGLALFLISSLISGPHWLSSWLKFSWWFSQADAGVNYANSVSWLGFFEAVGGAGNSMALIIGGVLVFLTSIGLALVWARGGRRGDLTAQLGLSLPGLILLPPHVMYYDMSLVIFSYSLLAERNIKNFNTIIAFIYLLGFSQIISKTLGFSPLFFVLLFTVILTASRLGRSAMRSDLR
ncbi:MAG: DUF2029 domain-containing protein [Syntrophobacterales bacterium]|jgi:hypothetical protein|nr:DUF2029 domain-containing protein [Syntrophobacterales bacterium]